MVKGIYKINLSLIGCLLFAVLFVSPLVEAKRVTIGRVITDGALVYEKPDFDSEPIAQLKKGTKVKVINKRFNLAFFKVELPSKKIGYILDIDIDFEGKKPIPPGPLESQDPNSSLEDPFLDAEVYQSGSDSSGGSGSNLYEWERLIGVRGHYISFKEKTMGHERRADLKSIGLVWRGPDWVDFAAYTDIGFSVTSKSPDYYQKFLGHEPKGFIGWGYLLFTTSTSLSSKTQMVYGFGPFLRASSWTLKANTALGTRDYDVTDLKLGGMGSWGLAYRFKLFAVRADFQFWWEASQYTSLALAIEVPFPK